jgi:hypothetical protein
LLPTEYAEKNVRNYEPALKMKQEDLYEVFKYDKTKHLNGFAKKTQSRESTRPPYNYYDNHLSFDTSTYFDKIRDASNLHERYIKEIESVRERISAWKNSSKKVELDVRNHVKCVPIHSDNNSRLQDRYAKEIEAMRERMEAFKSANSKADVANDIISINQSEIAPRPKKVAIKTRKVNISKMKKVKLPSTKISSTSTQISEFAERWVRLEGLCRFNQLQHNLINSSWLNRLKKLTG